MAMLLLADVCFANRSRLRPLSKTEIERSALRPVSKTEIERSALRPVSNHKGKTLQVAQVYPGGDCQDTPVSEDQEINTSQTGTTTFIPKQSSTPEVSAALNQNGDEAVIKMLQPKVTCPTLKLDDLLTFDMGWTVKSINTLVEIGRGSFGRVVLARHRHTGIPLAIKQPSWSDDFASPGEMVDELKATRTRATKEAMVQQLLSGSAYFPKFLGTLDLGNELCQAVEFVGCKKTGTGYPLHNPPSLPVSNVLKVAEDIIRGMMEFHNHGLLHNDLKNDNVLLEKRGKRYHAVIIDYGMVSSITAPPKMTGVTTELKMAYIYGDEADYMAPEVVLHEQPTSAASDVFSVGRILVDIAQIFGDLRSPWIQQISNIGMKCMAVNPDSRPSLLHILTQVTEVKKKRTPRWRRALRWISKKLHINRK